MVPEVVTIEPSASLADAVRVVKEANVGSLPVVDEGNVKGVLTDRDIVVCGIAHGLDVSITPVGDCLSREVICARPGWTADQAMKAMGDPEERLLGIVTLSSMALRAPGETEALETAKKVSRRSAHESAV